MGLALRTPRPLRRAGGRGPGGCEEASEGAGLAYALRNRGPKKKGALFLPIGRWSVERNPYWQGHIGSKKEILVGEAAQGSWAEGASALGPLVGPLLRPSDYSHQILSDRQNLVPP